MRLAFAFYDCRSVIECGANTTASNLGNQDQLILASSFKTYFLKKNPRYKERTSGDSAVK